MGSALRRQEMALERGSIQKHRALDPGRLHQESRTRSERVARSGWHSGKENPSNTSRRATTQGRSRYSLKLKSFGCSFIYGSELRDRSRTWPGIIAERLELEHENHGIEGAGNLRIMESILTHAEPDDICVINWTWIDRFDFVTVGNEQWCSIVPSDSHARAEFYYRNLHSQYRDMLTSLVYVKTALDHLDRMAVQQLMTYMDDLMFETVLDEWHDRRAVTHLQQQLRPHMCMFQDRTFLSWSRHNHYAESTLWHPLDPAHEAAADLMQPVIESILRRA